MDQTAGQFLPEYLPFLIPLIIWSLIWKGFALYRSARLGQKAWFIVFLILNTAGILEIVYLYIFTKRTAEK